MFQELNANPTLVPLFAIGPILLLFRVFIPNKSTRETNLLYLKSFNVRCDARTKMLFNV